MTQRHEDVGADVAVADKRALAAQAGLPAVYMRGGTSKGLFLHERDLPPPGPARDALILEVMGSPDPLQIDGMGGSHSSSSKVIIVAPSSRPDADVEYLFVQVGIDRPALSYDGNCGNLTAAVGPFSLDEGLVPVAEPTTEVRMYNRNTSKIVHASVPVHAGAAAVDGDLALAGIQRTGAAIVNEYRSPGSAIFPALYPTGSATDRWDVDGVGPVDVSIVDVSHPYLFVPAAAFGLSGVESPAELNQDRALLARLERLRATATVSLGLASSLAEAAAKLPAVPRIALVAAPRAYESTSGAAIAADDVDIVVRMVSMGRVHHACPATGVGCLAAACLLPGTVPAAAVRSSRPGHEVRLGHPKGVSKASARIATDEAGPVVESVTLVRTARRLMDGTLYHRRQDA